MFYEHGYGYADQDFIGGPSNINVTVTLSGDLTGVPDVVVACCSYSASVNPNLIDWYIVSYTQTQAVVRVRAGAVGLTWTVRVHVIALRAKT